MLRQTIREITDLISVDDTTETAWDNLRMGEVVYRVSASLRVSPRPFKDRSTYWKAC